MTLPVSDEEIRRRQRDRSRLMALLLGAFVILMFGIVISLQRFSWVQGDKAKWMGLIVSIVGFFQLRPSLSRSSCASCGPHEPDS